MRITISPLTRVTCALTLKLVDLINLIMKTCQQFVSLRNLIFVKKIPKFGLLEEKGGENFRLFAACSVCTKLKIFAHFFFFFFFVSSRKIEAAETNGPAFTSPNSYQYVFSAFTLLKRSRFDFGYLFFGRKY